MPITTDLISLSLAQTTAPDPVKVLEGAAPTTGTATGTAGTPATNQPTGPAGGLGIMLPIVLIMGMFLLMSTLSGRKEKKKRAALMAALGKGDKIITIGGQIGIVDQVRENEVVVRIDENSNTKARFTKAAIQQVLESSGGGSADTGSDSNGTIEVKTKGEKLLSAR